MKRKTIQLAKKTLVVSLPTEWVKANCISKGQDLQLDVSADSIRIRAEDTPKRGSTHTLNQKEIGPLLHRTLFQLYQQGADEITIHCTDPNAAITLKDKLRELIGFEITKQAKQTITIKDISGQNKEELSPALHRLFLILTNWLDDCIQAARTNDTASYDTLLRRDEDVNKFSNFCLRILTKTNKADAHTTYTIRTLEYIGDELKELLKTLKEHSCNEQEISLLEKLHTLLHTCYRLTLKPKLKTAQEIASTYDLIRDQRSKLQRSAISTHLNTLSRLIISIQEIQLAHVV